MAKIKLTKGELKRQRDFLRQYLRYLPTLQLKKQQLQMEILRRAAIAEEKKRTELSRRQAAESWSALLAEESVQIPALIKIKETIVTAWNIAGVDLPVFERLECDVSDYDLYLVPLWVDNALEALKALLSLRKEIEVLEKSIGILRQELRVTSQRVNLFEKVKIPAAEEAIRLIKIYIGDQMANAVGRSKMAKRKIEELIPEEALV
jgi:V/A-type H+-transporting ATPase subunit D